MKKKNKFTLPILVLLLQTLSFVSCSQTNSLEIQQEEKDPVVTEDKDASNYYVIGKDTSGPVLPIIQYGGF